MKKIAMWLGCAAILTADVVEQSPKDAAPSGLLAGVARANITPPVGIAQMNWGSQTHIAAEGVDPTGMYATALVLAGGSQKFAMVDVDALFVSDHEDIVRRASAATGIPPGHIRLGATHTHAGVAFTSVKGPPGADLSVYEKPFRNYQAELADKIVGAIIAAYSQLRPAHIYGGRGAGTININRRYRAAGENPPAVGRNPEGFVDRELIVFRIDDAAGKPYAVLVNFQCHGTVLAYENKFLSPDWIGMMRRSVEQALPGATCLYFQGAAGNQAPVEGYSGDLGVAHRLGSILGYEAAAVALGIETVRREPRFEGFVESSAYQAKQPWRVLGPRDATLKFASKTFEVPRRRYSPAEIDEMEKLVADARKKSDAIQSESAADGWKKYQAESRLRRLADLLAQWKLPMNPAPLLTQIQILRIGDLAIVSMPGEPFAEIGAAVKKASPFPFTMFCGYSTGPPADYMPIEPEYKYGGYEGQRTPYGIGAAEKVIQEATRLLREVQ